MAQPPAKPVAVGWKAADDAGNDTLCAQTLGASSILHSSIPTGGVGGDIGRAVTLLKRPGAHARRSDPQIRLRREDEAVATLTAGASPEGPIFHAIVLIDLATARVLQGEPEQACHELHRALDLALDAGFGNGVERIRGVRARSPPPGPTCARAFDRMSVDDTFL